MSHLELRVYWTDRLTESLQCFILQEGRLKPMQCGLVVKFCLRKEGNWAEGKGCPSNMMGLIGLCVYTELRIRTIGSTRKTTSGLHCLVDVIYVVTRTHHYMV